MCRTYRYRLVRVWDPNKPQLAWTTLTASDADDHRCIGFARVWPAPRACGSRVLGALFNACTANHTRSAEKPETDPEEGPIIPLGGAVTVMRASISFPPCRWPSMTIRSCRLGVSSPWQCRRAYRDATRFAHAVQPVENPA